MGIDEPLEIKIGNGSYDYRADGLGSVVAPTKSNGSAADSDMYDTFGGVSPASS